ncbi:phage tail assembly chaperone [Bacilliculturomica massiliensis]|uniref:phage tail assembly chaperone n=1 Tax=Bacilliculturomica massiliensis TaxID=1917867 RepID=UPI0010303265|nr:phage portal protein [Bacilliculturomica massiliensis]
MSRLNAFLSQNAAKKENVKYVVSQRFAENGTPVEWELRCITPKENNSIKKSCTYQAPVPGKKGLFVPETDYDAYGCRLAAACTVFPNLDDKELQDDYGVSSAEELLQVMLIPGEYMNYIAKVQEVNGFDIGMDRLVEDAKNS